MTAKTFVIDKPSKALVDLVNKLRERKIEKLEELNRKMDAFMAEVDSALSVSNALTEITIEY